MAKTPEQELIDEQKELATLANLPAGRLLIKQSKASCVGAINTLLNTYKTEDPSKLIPHLARLEANIAVYRDLTLASKRLEDTLDDILLEE